MGLPSDDEWPQDSPISREAFENCSRPIITLDRLVRLTDSCAFELLQVSFFSSIIYSLNVSSHYLLVVIIIQAKSSSNSSACSGA